MVVPDGYELGPARRKKTGNPIRPLFVPLDLKRLILRHLEAKAMKTGLVSRQSQT
jgi:hypothetical protein